MELFMKQAGIQLLHIPYGGSGPGINAVIAGHVDLIFSDSIALELAKSGKVRLLGISTKTRHPAVPDVPTVAEAGLPSFSAVAWIAVVAPAKTPADVVEKLHAEIGEVVRSPDFQEFLARTGSNQLDIPTIKGMRDFFKSEITTWGGYSSKCGTRGSSVIPTPSVPPL
jgi:tripartite-type tricarboxylate transporter receptor subunit TctC